MSDGILGAVAENLKDVVKETGKQAGSAIKDVPKVVVEQATGKEIIDRKQTQISLANVRSQIASLPPTSHERTGPEIISKQAVQEGFPARSQKKPMFKDLASLQAATKAETGRGNKG